MLININKLRILESGGFPLNSNTIEHIKNLLKKLDGTNEVSSEIRDYERLHKIGIDSKTKFESLKQKLNDTKLTPKEVLAIDKAIK